MTADEKNKIARLRKNGMGYLKISQTLGLNENTVKTFCRRNGLTGEVKPCQTKSSPESYRKPARIVESCSSSIPGTGKRSSVGTSAVTIGGTAIWRW